MFMVKVDMWNNVFTDSYDFEYSGIEHATREDAEKELEQAKIENAFNDSVESIYIVKV